MSKIVKLIEETQQKLNLTTEQLADKLFVPVTALEEWKRGLINPLYEPLLALSLMFVRITNEKSSDEEKQEQQHIIREICKSIKRMHEKSKQDDAEYYKKLHITGTCEVIDGKSVIKYFDKK